MSTNNEPKGTAAIHRPAKADDFSEWYNVLIDQAGLSDKRYPIKGMNVWTPYGWKTMRLMDSLLREQMEGTDHDEVCFPLLIPEDQFQKEADHIKGFADGVYWVTHGGLNPLEVKLLLRPTSETAMYPMFALWIRSHQDLPLKTFQIVNTFRYETHQTRSFIRVREIHFFESHTCHTTFEDAQAQIAEDLEVMKILGEQMCIPYLALQRPDWDKFPGADYTIGIDAYMPSGKTLQLASIHQYKDNFSKPYDITYETEDGEHKHVHQTTYGMSERLLGAIVGLHGDDKGLALPPNIAPFQVAIVPILAKGKADLVMPQCEKLAEELKQAGIRVELDDRDLRPGKKFFHWELKGVPLRMELGPRDIENDVVMAARRDTGEKIQITRADIAKTAIDLLESIRVNMLEKARTILTNALVEVFTMQDVTDLEGIGKGYWCSEEACGTKVEDETELSLIGFDPDHNGEGSCVVCGNKGTRMAYFARTY